MVFCFRVSARFCAAAHAISTAPVKMANIARVIVVACTEPPGRAMIATPSAISMTSDAKRNYQ
jgi:hypothetical protein